MEKSDLQRFRNECVAAHNFYRAAHGTPPICWSTRLAESAQTWAEQLASTTGSIRYSTAKDVGENLTCLWGSELNGQKITRIWYEEGQHFDYNKPRVSSRTRSFCQVVWEGTRELGAGAAVTKHGKQIVVARYFPPMNKKDVARNVKKARSTRDNKKPLAFDTRWSSLYVGLKEFHEECLSVHNEYRIRHGAAPLYWSAELAWEAQQWAENLARTGELRHNDDDTVGENLAGMVGAELSGREAVDIWYEEIESYDFENHGYSEDTSNFTQVVWVASENLGVGRAFDGDLCVVVAFYEPPGNMEGSFGDNVLRMGSSVRERKSKERKGFIPPTPDLEGFRLECLVTHNYFRARHGSPPLVLSSALTDEAQYWAERLLVTGASEGLDNSRIGISVAVLESGHVSGIKVSELWYKQILSYDFNSPGFSTETLDFSQLVWLSSRKMGVGKATGAEGVTVVVARYEPVGNIDGLFVQNVRRRGHERGSSEPMLFHVEYKYRIRTDSKSTNSFLSWEHDEAPRLEIEGDVTKSSDLDQFDENKNIVHRADEQESASSLTVTDAFTRLVWIDPNSPTLQRKGVAGGRNRGDNDYDDADDEEEEERDEMEACKHKTEEEQDEEDGRTAYEQDYTAETNDLDCVSEEPLAELEEAVLFSDPEDDLYQHIYEVRRSLSLDSEGTEPEMHKGNVLNKVAFFETFQRSFETQSRSNSESSFRRSLIQDELEELSRQRKRVSHAEDEQAAVEKEEEREEEEEEHECQLEFDDIFLAHREEDEGEEHVDEERCEEDDESLVSVSDTEEVLDFTDYDTRPEEDYEFQDNYCATHEFIEEEPSTLEIFDFSDEEASHQYADLTDPADKPRSSTKKVLKSMSLGTATEFHENKTFKFCKDEPADLRENAPDNYSEELFQTSEERVEVPETSFTRTLDPDHCFVTQKQDNVDTRMKELISKIGLLPVEDNKEDRYEVSDFNETIEGKLLENVFSGRKDHKIQDKRTPIEETCEAFIKDNVESEIDFEELFARLDRDSTESEEGDAAPQTSTEIERSESPDTVQAVSRDHESEHSASMERICGDIELQSSEQLLEGELEQEREFTPNITLKYESPKSMPKDDIEPLAETIEAVERDRKPENVDLEELDARMVGPTQIKTSREETIEDRNEVRSEEECCEAVLRDHDEERSRVFEEIGLVPVSPDITHSGDEPVEALPYEQAPKSTVSELPEVTELISAEVRRDVRCEINFEELFRAIDEPEDGQPSKETADKHFDAVQDSTRKEECCEAVFRDYDQKRDRDLQERDLELVPVSPDVIDSFSEPVEPLRYNQAPKSSPESQLPEVSEVVNAEVRQDVRSEINFEEMFLRLEEHVDETAETQRFEETEAATIEKTSRASLYVEEDTMVDDVHCASYKEEITVVEEVTAEIASSPKHVAGEGVNLERIEVVNEIKEEEEEKRASLIVDERKVVTEVHTESLYSQHVAGEAENIEPFEEVEDETEGDHDNRASLYMEEDHVIQNMLSEIFSNPTHIANECENINVPQEAEEIEEREEEKRASLYMDENALVDSVTTEEVSSCPLHIAGETLNVDPQTQREQLEPSEDKSRASMYSEEVISIAQVNCDTPLSSKHIACESVNTEFVEKVESQEPTVQENRASLYLEDDVLVDEIISNVPSTPKHIASESVNTELIEEVGEQIEDEKRASLFIEEETTVSYATTGIPSSPLHDACESANSKSVEEMHEEEFDEVEKRASLFLEEDSIVNEIVPDTPSSTKHIAGESYHVEAFEEIDEEPNEERKRASLFLEEAAVLDEVTTDVLSSPKHVAAESRNVEPFEEIQEEPTEESKRASLFMEEAPNVEELTTDVPSSPKHVAAESRNVEPFEEIQEEPTEESKRASLFMEEAPNVEELTTDVPSSPKHVAAESRNVEPFEEIQEEPTEESKRASLFMEEAPNVEELTTDVSSSPKHVAAESRNEELFEDIQEEPTEESNRVSLVLEEAAIIDDVATDTPSSPKHLAGESVNSETFEEVAVLPEDENKRASVFLEEDITYGYISLEVSDQNHHVAGEISNSGVLEVTDDEDSPESDYGEHFQEFEGIYGTQETFVEPPKPTHIAGEIRNIDAQDQAVEEVLKGEESLEYEDRPQMVITTDLLETTQPSFHIAGELSNVEPREESSEEEKPEEEASAEELEETQVQASIVVLKSPQSLLSIAAAALEQNIDAAQQDASEECTTQTDIAQQYSEEENGDVKTVVLEALTLNACLVHEREGLKQHEETVEKTMILEHSPIIYEETETTDVLVSEDTKEPAIIVNIAGERSDKEEDNVFVEDEHQEVHEIETERYEDHEETAIEYPAEEQQVQSHATAEFCVSEFVLNEGKIEEQTDFVEPFEESEEGSVSELLSECSSSPRHVSSELKDFQDYETISEEYGIETYHAITYEEGDYVSERSITKGLPSLFITEELTPHDIYQENKVNEQSMVLETGQEYNEAEEPLQIQTSIVTSQSTLQTTAELSASDDNDGVKEEDGLSEREFMEEFVGTEILKESTTVVSTSDPQLAENEDDLLDETDNAQRFDVQETLVNVEQPTRETYLAVLTAEGERVFHKEKEIPEEVWEVEVKKGSQYVETFEEKHEASQIQKFTVVSDKEQRSVEMRSSYQVLESKESYSVSQTHRGERVLVGEQGTQIELSHEMEEKVEVFSTRTMHHHVSSTTSTSANEFTTMGTQFQSETNDACMSHEEVRNIQEISFTAIQQTSQQRSWKKEEEGLPVESSDQLSESILDKETKDHELEKFEKQLSEEEKEVRLMKSEVMECKKAERQAPLVSPRVTVERETTFVKALVVNSGTKEEQEQVLMREDRIAAILKDDEASLEEESAGEQFEEEIDIMRVDEALSEEEFRGEGDRVQSRSSKADSKEDLDKSVEQYEEGVKIREEESFYEEEFEVQRVRGQVEEAPHESDDKTIETPAFEEEVEVAAVEGSGDPVKESSEPAEVIEVRVQQSVFEEELEVSACPKEDSSVQEDYPEEDRQVDRSAVFEEELEVLAVAVENEPVEEQNKPVDYSAVFEEELEVERFEKQNIEEEIPVEHSAVFEEELDVSAMTSHEPVAEQHTKGEERQAVLVEGEEHKSTDDEKSEERTDEEPIETTHTSTHRQPFDLSQVDLYDDGESASETRYYVELSSTESLEPAYEEVEDETCYTETYVRQGDPLEENLEEFILVRCGDEFESSGEEDISDHREIYVIPEEENDVENHVAKAARDGNVKAEEPKPEHVFEEGFENMGLEEIRESPEFDIDSDSDSDELDEEEQRQLEEYERLESFVILEEKLSQVESDDDEIADLQGEEGDENVFHSDVHSSSEETLHEDELAETMIASSIQKAAASSERTCKEGEVSQGDNFSQSQEQSNDDQKELPVEYSSTREELPEDHEGLTVSKVAREVTLDEGTENNAPPKEDTGDESLSEDPADKKADSRTKDEKTEQHLSSDSSGEQSMSSEGSLSSTLSVDMEGLDNFEQDCLLQHNLYRRQHRVKLLKWSEELAEGAKRWAEHLASVNSLESFEGKEVGENLTSVQGKELNGTEAADMWYKEVTDYNFEDPAFNAKCGRFTQVVWASSREFGVARFLADDGTQYVVARYKPAGNIVGDFKENVKPPKERLKRRRSSARRRSKSGTPSTPAEREKFKTECVISHNYYRTFHDAPALRWSPLLAAEAQNYAERLAKTDSLTHSGQKDRGENLAYTWDSPLSARGAIDMWYDEVQDYDFENPGFTSDTGHFTQLVWVGTEEFGMGMAVAPDGRNIVVGRYVPPGNIVGQFKENVRPRGIDGIP